MKNANFRYHPEEHYKTNTEIRSKSDFLSDFFARLQNAYASTKNLNQSKLLNDFKQTSQYSGIISHTHSEKNNLKKSHDQNFFLEKKKISFNQNLTKSKLA